MPSSLKRPSRVPMWRGVKYAYLIIAMCLFPIAIGGYWAYGNLVTTLQPNLSSLCISNFLFEFHKIQTKMGEWIEA
jgi:hypothetical protein